MKSEVLATRCAKRVSSSHVLISQMETKVDASSLRTSLNICPLHCCICTCDVLPEKSCVVAASEHMEGGK